MKFLILALVSVALGGDVKTISATTTVDALKSATTFVAIGTVDTGKTGTAKLECKVSDAKLACRSVSKTETKAVQVTTVNAKTSTIAVAVNGTTINVSIKGDLVGIMPDPWAD